jgi:hypothetical protein
MKSIFECYKLEKSRFNKQPFKVFMLQMRGSFLAVGIIYMVLLCSVGYLFKVFYRKYSQNKEELNY